jgi:hypothetical protein
MAMTGINFPRDDESLVRLKISDKQKKPGAVQETQQIEPYPRIMPQSRTGSHTKAPYRAPMPNPILRKKERRKANRRRKNIPVLLDTRSQYGRRTQARRHENEQPDISVEPNHGIDKTA